MQNEVLINVKDEHYFNSLRQVYFLYKTCLNVVKSL